MTSDEPTRRRVTLNEVRSHRSELIEAARQHGVLTVKVFGSVARGESGETSDLDLLVDVEPGTGLLKLAGFALAVEDVLHVPTQVATAAGLRPRIRDRVMAEAVAL